MSPPDLRALVESRLDGSIAAVADRVGVPVRTLDKWVRGDRVPPPYVMAFVRAAIEALPERRLASSS